MPHASGQPTIYIIAGPNGAGKTTFAKSFLPNYVRCKEFLNADLIAAGLSPFNSSDVHLQAAELMLLRMDMFVAQRISFAFETTLAGQSYAKKIPQWKAQGYEIAMLFLWLPSIDLAVQRVQNRVKQGGHDIPEPTIQRRYHRGLSNFLGVYFELADIWQLFDASANEAHTIAVRESSQVKIADALKWAEVVGPYGID